jgi:hypothetical protein
MAAKKASRKVRSQAAGDEKPMKKAAKRAAPKKKSGAKRKRMPLS